MNLIIDTGNTAVKLAVFSKKNIIFNITVEYDNFISEVENIFSLHPKINQAIISSTKNIEEKITKVIKTFCSLHTLSHESRVPFTNAYVAPKSLGVDRIVLASAAFNYNPNGNTLVIDAGTCITYDFINGVGVYLGGAISPGVVMRYKAMHRQTDKLPLLHRKDPLDIIGNSTETSMHSGVVNGVCAEIDGVIQQYKARFADLTVILTGGDAQFLSNRLKNTIFANSNFLLEGLNDLLEYNKH